MPRPRKRALPPLPEPVDVQFRFNEGSHTYTELGTGVVFPHITGLLERAGWVDSTWYTEESRIRGDAVHRLTAAHDLGGIDLSVESPYRAYLLAHIGTLALCQVSVLQVETPRVHPTYRFAGRPDREVLVHGRHGPWDLKTGAKERSHGIQTGLQAILLEPVLGIPAQYQGRWCAYLREHERPVVVEHHKAATAAKDLLEAQRIIREYVMKAA